MPVMGWPSEVQKVATPNRWNTAVDGPRIASTALVSDVGGGQHRFPSSCYIMHDDHVHRHHRAARALACDAARWPTRGASATLLPAALSFSRVFWSPAERTLSLLSLHTFQVDCSRPSKQLWVWVASLVSRIFCSACKCLRSCCVQIHWSAQQWYLPNIQCR